MDVVIFPSQKSVKSSLFGGKWQRVLRYLYLIIIYNLTKFQILIMTNSIVVCLYSFGLCLLSRMVSVVQLLHYPVSFTQVELYPSPEPICISNAVVQKGTGSVPFSTLRRTGIVRFRNREPRSRPNRFRSGQTVWADR